VWRVLGHLGLSEADVSDASQEVFLIVLRRLPTFERRSSLRTWIYGICRNVAQRTRIRRQRETTLDELDEPRTSATQDSDLWLKQAHAELVTALATLDSDQRTVFILYEIEGCPMDEIAASVGAPTTTCYSRLQSARQKVMHAFRRKEQRGSFRMLKGGVQ
jgi:RNA polymerase sigma-70 factor (ECF subfamily)